MTENDTKQHCFTDVVSRIRFFFNNSYFILFNDESRQISENVGKWLNLQVDWIKYSLLNTKHHNDNYKSNRIYNNIVSIKFEDKNSKITLRAGGDVRQANFI